MKSERPEASTQTSLHSGPAARASPGRQGRAWRLLRPAPLIASISIMILLVWIAAAVSTAVGSALIGIMTACLAFLAGVIIFNSLHQDTNRTRR